MPYQSPSAGDPSADLNTTASPSVPFTSRTPLTASWALVGVTLVTSITVLAPRIRVREDGTVVLAVMASVPSPAYSASRASVPYMHATSSRPIRPPLALFSGFP